MIVAGRAFGLCALALLATSSRAAEIPAARRASDIARAILPCWHPPVGGGDITLALSLRRDGSVIGAPRVTYASGPSGDLRVSILEAVGACTPVALSWPLGAIIAGQVLRIRFSAAPDGAGTRASVIWSGT